MADIGTEGPAAGLVGGAAACCGVSVPYDLLSEIAPRAGWCRPEAVAEWSRAPSLAGLIAGCEKLEAAGRTDIGTAQGRGRRDTKFRATGHKRTSGFDRSERTGNESPIAERKAPVTRPSKRPLHVMVCAAVSVAQALSAPRAGGSFGRVGL